MSQVKLVLLDAETEREWEGEFHSTVHCSGVPHCVFATVLCAFLHCVLCFFSTVQCAGIHIHSEPRV